MSSPESVASTLNGHAQLNTPVESGFTAIAVVDGRADMAIQQLSELRFIPKVQIVGPLPESVQHYTEFAAALGTTPSPAAMQRL